MTSYDSRAPKGFPEGKKYIMSVSLSDFRF
jgi:hypothetical protein